MVFQDYALFPHKDVDENIRFGLRMQGWSRQRQERRVHELLALVGLQSFATRAVYDLSGGEQQRVALARALATEPSLLLLDEPLGALDHALRERLLRELRTILNNAESLSEGGGDLTAIYVTHDQAEAFAVADRVALLREGRLEQVDTPVAMYRRPRTPFVARFLGMENLFEGRLTRRQPPTFSCVLGDVNLAPSSLPPDNTNSEYLLLVRPDAGRIVSGEASTQNVITARIDSLSFRGRFQEVDFMLPGDGTLSLELDPGVQLPAPGKEAEILLEPERLILIAASPS
jgi:ABC-type Fe3+/spermidine/putrescine transport system ATPase subunit